jgi:hypothetical protein
MYSKFRENRGGVWSRDLRIGRKVIMPEDTMEKSNVWDGVKLAIPRIPTGQLSLVLLALVVVASTAPIFAIRDGSNVVGIALVVLLVGFISFLLFLTQRTASSLPQGIRDRQAAIAKLPSHWIQWIGRGDGFSVFKLAFDVFGVDSEMTGERYSPEGVFRAQFAVNALSVYDVRPIQIFYYWHGKTTGTKEIPDLTTGGEVDGIGFIHLSHNTSGWGWFASGQVSELHFGPKQECTYQALNADESSAWDIGGDSRASLVRSLSQRVSGSPSQSPLQTSGTATLAISDTIA